METAQVNTEQGSSSTNTYYVWEVPGKNVVIHLDYAVVDRLLLEVMRGFGAIPRRGAEVGGVLLGSVEPGERMIVRVEDFEPVVCEHRRGPSYLLSEGDTNRYEESVARHRFNPEKRLYAIGGYRSHTREGMALTSEDLKQWDTYYPEASSIFLLIKPFATRVSMAGFFFREDGKVHSEAPYHEFPFRRRELGGGASPTRIRESANPVAGVITSNFGYQPGGGGGGGTMASEPEPEAEGNYEEYGDPYYYEHGAAEATYVPEETGVSRFRKTNIWIPLSFIFLLFGVLIGILMGTNYRSARAAGVLHDAYSLQLSVSRSADYLQVHWDRTSQVVRSAQRGVLTITEGQYDKKVDLDAIQLQNPTVYVRHQSDSVKFRMEIFLKDRVSVVETFEWKK